MIWGRKRRHECRRGKLRAGATVVSLVAAGPIRLLGRFGDPPLLLQVCFVVPIPFVPFFFPCLTLGCRQMPASLRANSLLADPSESDSENGGPSCPIVSTSDSSPNGSTQEGALQTFLQRRKNGSSSLVPRPAPYWLWHSEPSRSLALKSAHGGSPTKRRATRTVLAKQRSCWSGGHSNQSLLSL